MYIYDEEKECYFFDGDFEKYLLSIGVSESHIQLMKEKIIQRDRDIYYDYHKREEEMIELVPLDKILGTNRSTAGWSVYDNVYKMYRGDREPSRFHNCFNFLNKMTIEELRKSYENMHPIRLVHYYEDDDYYLNEDGNHRMLTAMILGAEKINAKVTTVHEDSQKRKKYFASSEFYSKYNIIDIMSYVPQKYSIIMKIDNVKYKINGFEKMKTTEDCFSLINRLSAEIDSDIRKVRIFKRIPWLIRKVIFYYEKNRIEDYFNPIEDFEKESYYYYSKRINLYEL